ncbi:MAG: helix-turn-helix transcriptional regulator [Alkalinema sp. RU_4_3]|nr:helix-turn-helix transcriptional regulator [Alkalinema sp. RU_4_3]
MKPGSKYYRLFQHLQTIAQPEITLTIEAIAQLIDGDLSPKAYETRAWWSNRDSKSAVQAAAWIQAGYHITKIDLPAQTITFQKFQTQYNIKEQNGTILWDQTAIKALRKHMDLTQADFSQELGVRRQTVSEWESGVYLPDRATSKHFDRLAKQVQFPKDQP